MVPSDHHGSWPHGCSFSPAPRSLHGSIPLSLGLTDWWLSRQFYISGYASLDIIIMQNVLLQLNGSRGYLSLFLSLFPFLAIRFIVGVGSFSSHRVSSLPLSGHKSQWVNDLQKLSTVLNSFRLWKTHTTRDVYWFRLAIYFTPMIRWRKPLKPPLQHSRRPLGTGFWLRTRSRSTWLCSGFGF